MSSRENSLFRRVSFLASSVFALSMLATLSGCTSDVADDGTTGDDQDVTSESATLTFGADFSASVKGELVAGKSVRVDYDLARLPGCRGNVGGGGPGYNFTGYYSENGGEAKLFEVSKLSEDGKDRVAKPASIKLTQGGDVAIWFQVSSRFGCSEFDSNFGQNYHFEVGGKAPTTGASIVFGSDGKFEQSGAIHGGEKISIRYDQGRLTKCEQTQGGHPVWTISGFAQVDGDAPKAFDTGRAEGSDREAIDAIVQIPAGASKLALWFQSNSVSGCNEYDSNGGQNYVFAIE